MSGPRLLQTKRQRIQAELANWGRYYSEDSKDPAEVHYYEQQPWYIDTTPRKFRVPPDARAAERCEAAILRLRRQNRMYFGILLMRYYGGRKVDYLAKRHKVSRRTMYRRIEDAELALIEAWKQVHGAF